MKLTARTRQIILIACCGVLFLTFAWVIFRGQSSELSKVCNMLSEFGYNYLPEDITVLFDKTETTISAVLESDEESLSDAVEASGSAGFPSEIDKVGSVTLLAVADGEERIIFLYMLNGEPCLCFVQDTDGSIIPLGE